MARSTNSTTTINLNAPPHLSSTTLHILRLLESIVLILLFSVASLAAQLALHPLYGSAPTSFYHSTVTLIACGLSVLLPLDFAEKSERMVFLLLASWLGYAPHSTYVLGVWWTQWHIPREGSAAVQAIILVPLLSVGIALGRNWNSRLIRYLPGSLSLRVGVALGAFNALKIVDTWLRRSIPFGGFVNSSNMFVAIAAILTLLAGLAPSGSSSAPPPSSKSAAKNNKKSKEPSGTYKHAIPFLLPVLAAALAFSRPPAASPSLPYTRRTPPAPVNSTSPAPTATVRMLARTYGTSGLVVVGEHAEEEYRFMRVDHSLLGGRWYGDKVASDARNGLGDSIYSAFVLQEAARLVRRYGKKDNDRALFIGLGIGAATEAFIAHGINTTVVEIDPAVYTYAREYFGLPEPARVYLEDARGWVHKHKDEKFDYVVHDCFSGGEVPEHLYTVEFWTALQEIVAPDGVVAVNYAGEAGSDAARAVFLTLRRSFGTCRAFHDQIGAKFDPGYSFFNIVYFCTLKGTSPPKFREAVEADFLMSHLRLHVFSEFPKREMNASTILGNITYVEGTEKAAVAVEGEEHWILCDDANSLGKWQRENGVEHWEVMREVLPDIFWETY